MRYKEAYELVDAALLNANLEFPVLEATKSFIFDNKVQEVGLRTVKKHNTETFSTTGGRAFTFTNPDITTQVYKVELGDKNVPFVPEGGTNSNAANDDIDQIGFYLKNETVSEGTISAATSANPIVVTSASHGLETGDFVNRFRTPDGGGIHGIEWDDGKLWVTAFSPKAIILCDPFDLVVNESTDKVLNKQSGKVQGSQMKVIKKIEVDTERLHGLLMLGGLWMPG